MLSNFIKILGGNPHQREVEKYTALAQQINALEADYEELSDEALRAKTEEFRMRLAAELKGIDEEKEHREAEKIVLDALLPEAFAAVREASKRTLGLRHYDVQLIGGAALHNGTIAEMRTGEGKTLVATLPLYLNALTRRGVHLITVNDYLARRDARWMGAIYHALGLSVGVLQMAASTENGKKAFLYDPEKESPREDQDKLRLVDRRLAYEADITYGTNSEFGFDYLRDNMVYRPDDKVQRGHYYAIVDEVDNVLIDEARTPLIISGPASGELDTYVQMAQVVKQLALEDYEANEKDRSISLTEIGTVHVEQILGQPLRDLDRPEDVTPEQARLLGYLEQALRAQYLFHRNKDYLVQGGKVIIVDEFTGRLMPGRRWSDGLHQAVEAKEGVKVEPENVTYATITLQNYFRMYEKLAGMTGTALTESEEFHKIYKLEVLPIPTNLEYIATLAGKDSSLIEVKAKDEDGYDVAYFAQRPSSGSPRPQGDGKLPPVFWRRSDYPDLVYRTVEAKLRAIVAEIVRDHVLGRPVLVGTTSVESSERLSGRLRAEPVRRLLQVKLLRQVWFEQNNREEDGRLAPELEPLYKPLDQLEPTFLRQFAKPLNISINPEDAENLEKLLQILHLDSQYTDRLKAVIQGGVAHEVLNARKHTEESQIIAGAGAFGAVTIATNMAGRGVDIKLGGDLAEEITAVVSRVLHRAGYDPYNMRLEEQRQAILKMDPTDFGIYEAEVKFFLKYFADMAQVRKLGGLHVVGSERHEARRIDNQLRGRSARQGDPGSSRFYLSLQDDLMRLFGGEQVEGLMTRFRLDDDFPLENRMVTGLIESSQHRVEGANFDVRKHLLEYDDVLNKQRAVIYAQRDRVMTKDDLSEDVAALLKDEVAARVPPALADAEGPWKLLAWLDQVQPAFAYGENRIYPTFAHRLLLDELDLDNLGASLLDLVRRAVEVEEGHIQKAIEINIQRTSESLEAQIDEHFEALDTFFEGLRENEEQKRPAELLDELKSALRMDVRLGGEQLKLLASDPAALEEPLKEQVDIALSGLAIKRLIASIEYRLGEQLGLKADELARVDWDDAAAKLLAAVEKMLQNRRERLMGEKGQVARDIEALLARVKVTESDESPLIAILSTLARGRRMGFNLKTRKVEAQEYQRFNYVHLAALLLAGRRPEDVQADVLEHLETAAEMLVEGWGQAEFARISQNTSRLSDFGPAAEALGLNPDAPLSSLTEEQRAALMEELGRRRMTEVFRSVLLGVITELWVDYLTRVEALRVSIGLEAYGQRDPLVQYKSKASEMFQNLLGEVRSGVIDRVFRYLPRPVTIAEAPAETAVEISTPAPAEPPSAKAGRKRHKKR
jgi:preprotein translocase subunit SecA